MKRILLCILSMLILVPVWGQKYLEYSPNCMDRMIYKLVDSKKGRDFVSYQIHLGNNQYIHLEVGSENTRLVQSPPEKPSSCVAFSFSRKLVEDINQSKKVIYVTRKVREGYIVSPVKKAAYFYQIGSELEYSSKDAQFSLNLDNPVYGRNLAIAGSKNQVFLDGVDFNQCAKGYIIRKTENLKAKDYKEITFSPGIGIIEKRAVNLMRGKAAVNIIKLESVNGRSAIDYIAGKCVEVQATAYDKGAISSESNTYGAESTRLRADPAAVNAYVGAKGSPCGAASSEGVHVVQKGETLYSIARRYGISLAQLKTWNGIDSRNLIQPCQALNVISKAAMTQNQNAVVTSTRTSNTTNNFTKAPTSTSNNTNAGRKNSNTTFDRTYLTGGTPAWAYAGNTHTVARSENVASISKKYGYTQERLRWMNGMGEREEFVSGQVVRVDGCSPGSEDIAARSNFSPYSEETDRIAAQPSDVGDFREFTPKSVDYSNVRVHIVLAGETLFSIARNYNSSVDRIRELNGFSKGEVIMQSQRIYVD